MAFSKREEYDRFILEYEDEIRVVDNEYKNYLEVFLVNEDGNEIIESYQVNSMNALEVIKKYNGIATKFRFYQRQVCYLDDHQLVWLSTGFTPMIYLGLEEDRYGEDKKSYICNNGQRVYNFEKYSISYIDYLDLEKTDRKLVSVK